MVLLFGLGVALAACSQEPDAATRTEAEPAATPPPSPTPLRASTLPDLGPAPDFNNRTWLNTDHPLTLAKLRGRVVLLEFWTFG